MAHLKTKCKPMERHSEMWKHFKLINKTYAECNNCPKKIKCQGGTSGLWIHFNSKCRLNRRHSEECKPKKRYSWVWAYFEKIDKELRKCKICGKIIKCKNKGTTGMWLHLKQHKDLLENQNLTHDFNAAMPCNFI